MKAILVSHRFNPGHLSHIEANAAMLQEEGYEIEFRLNKLFNAHIQNNNKNSRNHFFQCHNATNNDLFIVWFPSVRAMAEVLYLRLFSNIKVIYIYHEPFTSISSYLSSGFGIIKTTKIVVVSLISKITSALSHKIILPSCNAFNAIPQANRQPKRFAQINLMFLDEAKVINPKQVRQYISYIGTIAEDHAFDEFINLAYKTIKMSDLLPYQFLIATRSDIPTHLRTKVDYCLNNGRMLVQAGTPLTNAEINNFYSTSLVVWNAYRRSMQSGVLPKAYMFGTPVLVTQNNKSEFFSDKIHGIMISNSYSHTEFLNAITNIESNWDSLSYNCRASFIEFFYYLSLKQQFFVFIRGNS